MIRPCWQQTCGTSQPIPSRLLREQAMSTCKCKPTRRGRPPKPERKGLLTVLAAATCLLLVTGGYLWTLGGPAPPRAPVIGGPFTLTAADGQPVTDESFRGRYLLVYFGYTACEDVCPVTLSAVADALEILGPKAGRLEPIFVTVDPL